MSTFALLFCLLVADDPLEEIKERIVELESKDAVVARDAYQRLKVLTRSPNKVRAAAAKAAVEEYERKNRIPPRTASSESPPRDDRLRINSAKEFYDKDNKPLYTKSGISDLSITTKDFGDAEMRHALQLPDVEWFTLYGTAVTGRDFAELKMPKLKLLTFERSPITDDSLCALNPANMPELIVLHLNGTEVTDKGLAGCQLTGIGQLNICDTKITRDGLKALARFPKLQSLRMDYKAFDISLLSQIAAGEVSIKNLRLAYTPDEAEKAKVLEKYAPPGMTLKIYPK